MNCINELHDCIDEIGRRAATKLLKADARTAGLTIIALPVFAMTGDENKMMAAGCDGYIAKPFQYQEFLDKVEVALGARR